MSQLQQHSTRSPLVAACALVLALRVAVDLVQGSNANTADILAAVGYLLLAPFFYFRATFLAWPAKPGAWMPSDRSIEILVCLGGLCLLPSLLLMFVD